MKIIFGLFFAFHVFGNCFIYAQNIVPPNFDLFINNVMQANKLPGLSIAVVKGESGYFAKGYGVRTLGKPELVNEHTLFQTASITKAFTATLLGILVDKGKIKWTDPVSKFIPGFETSEPFVTQRLSIQDLVTLRSGLLGGDTLRGANRTDLIPQIKSLKISNSFRISQTSYNLNFALSGLILELVEGKSWEAIVKNELFLPLNMNETYTDIPSALGASKNISTPNYIENEKVVATEWDTCGIYSPADAIISNAVDLAQFVKLYLQNGKFENNSIIKSEVLTKMVSPQMIPATFAKDFFNPRANIMSMGLGWFVSDYKGYKIIQMAGLSNGDTNIISIIPALNTGIVLQTNLAGAFDAFGQINYKIIDDLISTNK